MPLPNVRDARQLIQLYYGTKVETYPVESDVTVGTTAVKLGSYALRRVAIVLTNWGTVNVALGFSNAVTATTGTVLVPSGWLTFNWQLDGETVMNDLYGIAGGAGNSVHVVEYVLSGL